MMHSESGIENFSDNFILSSNGNEDYIDTIKPKIRRKKLISSVQDVRPFKDHWTLTRPIRNFTFPKSRDSNKNYLIDFWSNFETGESLSLPNLGFGRSDSIRRISCDILKNLINSTKKFVIIDCRYDYEYSGGHIKGAININNSQDIEKIYNEYLGYILIFHCEYSSVRAPKLAHELRNFDRKMSKYPFLNFPEIYILDGGYSKFYRNYKKYCQPMGYVPMVKRPKKLQKKN